ncbi:hypothetical protein [Corallibacter sp.]|uniref:hypothetical protein n=1 Tax=Corallibacter sp. TaxID=2038084 RepID=UPI003A928AF8
MKQFMLLAFAICSSFICFSQTDDTDTEDLIYRRSSLYTLMMSDINQSHGATIQNAFINYPIPDKFNNHNLEKRTILKIEKDSLSRKEFKEQIQTAITDSLNTNYVAKLIISKWFNRSEKGGFNMNLISERGNYNATDLDVHIARNSERGTALLADAGEELIKNTFIVINNFKYTNKEEVAKKANGLLTAVSSLASATGYGDVSLVADVAAEGVDVLGKGYVIKTDSYLYRLVWNDEVASIFYNNFWTEDSNIDLEKVKAFDESDAFELEYIGKETAWADLQSTKYTTKSDDDLISVATVKASDAVIAKLQRSYEVFRTKTPLLSGDPLAAKIGLKEGIEKGDKYEVLEQVINKEGKTEYKRMGIIKVEKKHIWDNRFMASEENQNPSEFEYTTFKGPKNKYFQGMLIRQIN